MSAACDPRSFAESCLTRSRRHRYAVPRPSASAPGCGPRGPTRHGARAACEHPQIELAYRLRWQRARRELFSSAYQRPSRGHRVKGACGVAHDRFATLDPLATHQGFGACEEEGGEVGQPNGDEDQGGTMPGRVWLVGSTSRMAA
jgi:hypothetical protein